MTGGEINSAKDVQPGVYLSFEFVLSSHSENIIPKVRHPLLECLPLLASQIRFYRLDAAT